jgi:hypothetical protein
MWMAEVGPELLSDLVSLLMTSPAGRYEIVRDALLERLEELCMAGFKASEQYSQLHKLLDPKGERVPAVERELILPLPLMPPSATPPSPIPPPPLPSRSPPAL